MKLTIICFLCVCGFLGVAQNSEHKNSTNVPERQTEDLFENTRGKTESDSICDQVTLQMHDAMQLVKSKSNSSHLHNKFRAGQVNLMLDSLVLVPCEILIGSTPAEANGLHITTTNIIWWNDKSNYFATLKKQEIKAGSAILYRDTFLVQPKKQLNTSNIQWTISPNPASDVITIQIFAKGSAQTAGIQILDATGRTVVSSKVEILQDIGTSKMNTEGLRPGAYTVVLSLNTGDCDSKNIVITK